MTPGLHLKYLGPGALRLYVHLTARVGPGRLLLQRGWTPLRWAATEGHADVVRVLLEAGANMEVANKWASGEGPGA